MPHLWAILPDRVSLRLENSGSVARDHLASERTFLAYVRTSLAITASGVGKFSIEILTYVGLDTMTAGCGD